MEITIVTQDTRGGVQPYAALARALTAAGHAVRAVAPADYAWLFERQGVPCLRLDGMSGPQAREVALRAQKEGLGGLRAASQAISRMVPAWAVAMREFAAGSDVVTGGVGGAVLGRPVAAAIDATWVWSQLQPVGLFNPAYPGALVADLPPATGLAGRIVGQAITEAAVRLPFLPLGQAARRALRVRAGSLRSARGAVYGISPRVIEAPPRRRDLLVAGYWFDDTDPNTLPPEVEAFLAADDDPAISVGFGSMVTGDVAGLTSLIEEAARNAGVRVVLITGGGALAAAPGADASRTLAVDSIPHAALFHRTAANVHHGGAGTTASALAAGVPGVVVPFGADQPFWARRAHDLGVSPRGLPVRSLTPDGLAGAIREALTDAAMRQRAADLGRHLRAEDGTRVAADWFGRLAA